MPLFRDERNFDLYCHISQDLYDLLKIMEEVMMSTHAHDSGLYMLRVLFNSGRRMRGLSLSYNCFSFISSRTDASWI